ncbi:MAG: ArgD: acetylornithine aminotransferase [Candidatus Hydrogenedentota bacterium]|jgi:predicted acetylornithine/succinylornithine family transaminase
MNTTLADLTGIRALQHRNDAHVLNTYGARRLAFGRGEGVRLWDVEGREYLDFFSGIAVNGLGYAHPAVTRAIQEQAAKLLHTSNYYYIESQIALAELLCEHTFADKWFFCNSGAEANEAAIKLARRYWSERGTPKPGIIATHHGFHGRTMATVTMTGQPKYHAGFEPMLPGVSHVEYNNLGALEAAVTPETGAIILEPIQGEGGVNAAMDAYLQGARNLCDRAGILLILDEVQSGNGRTGALFAHELYGVTPDIMTTAKGLGNGVPIGAMGCTNEVASGFSVGSHGCTFGGNPLSTAAALATLSEILKPGFLAHVRETGAYFAERLAGLLAEHDEAVEVRGKGLMLGVKFAGPVAPLVVELADAGFIVGNAGPDVLRILPPLIITKEHIDSFMAVLPHCIRNVSW